MNLPPHVSLHATLARTLSLGLLALALGSQAADLSPPEPQAAATQDRLAAARAQIAARNWSGAIAELQRVNDTGSADWNNLMGYSLRKAKTPDLAASQRYYDAALRIDPQHRGTLAYSGELYLMKGELPRAEARLAALDAACAKTCPEYAELQRSIERYKAAGNRVVSGEY